MNDCCDKVKFVCFRPVVYFFNLEPPFQGPGTLTFLSCVVASEYNVQEDRGCQGFQYTIPFFIKWPEG